MFTNIEPKEVFSWFYKLNQFPRCSGNEKAVSDFLVDFAKERNLEYIQDSVNNVIIKKPASPGYEKSEPVIIQGHMDMVCVKTADSDHDFEKDPIQMYVDGDLVKAEKTTLGGDDGIAVAFALAILDGDYKHPELEVLITVEEETTMKGAGAIKPGMLKGKTLLNIDSEEEGIFLVSSAGGNTVHLSFEKEYEDFEGRTYKLTIAGLKGGHSGMEINKQRANAILVLMRLIDRARKAGDLRLCHLSGGVKHNAIPSQAQAGIRIKDQASLDGIKDLFDQIKKEYAVEDKDLSLTIEEVGCQKTYSKDLTDRLIDYFNMVPDGVVAMSKSIEGLVQTSLNNAVVEDRDQEIFVITSVRSSVESELDKTARTLELIAQRTGASFEEVERYPAWEYEENSKLKDIALDLYQEMFKEEAVYTAVHAGLECGLLKKVLPDTEMLSFGPNMWDAHSPKERISIESTQRVFDFTVKLLEKLK
ncbi:MAG: aminoacyl-histidine dipeptidase [Bacillota bacterium]|nr:aminoacyl-histidine dipeptidase [Bacillota bacterium]